MARRSIEYKELELTLGGMFQKDVIVFSVCKECGAIVGDKQIHNDYHNVGR